MVPWYAVIVLMVTSGFFSGALVYVWRKPRKAVEVDRTQKEVRPLNVFDAYSDSDLAKLRKEVADSVKTYREYGSRLLTEDKARELRKIDDEIEARKNAKLALEETKRTEHERDIAIFDTVYGHILSDTEKKKRIK